MSAPDLILMGARLRSKIEQEVTRESRHVAPVGEVTSLTPVIPPDDSLPLKITLSSSHSHICEQKLSILEAENGELLKKCEGFLKDMQRKDKIIADLTKTCEKIECHKTELEQKNKQLVDDQQAVQQYIDRLKANENTASAVTAKLQDGFERYQHDLSRMSQLHEAAARSLLRNHEDNSIIHEQVLNHEDTISKLKECIDDMRAQSYTSQLELDTTRKQHEYHVARYTSTLKELEQYRHLIHSENKVTKKIDSTAKLVSSWREDINALSSDVKKLIETLSYRQESDAKNTKQELQLLHEQVLTLTNSNMAKISEDVAHSGNEANHEPFQTNPISSKAMIECSASPNAFSTAGECGRKRKLDNIIFENLPDIHESGKDLQKKDITTLSACSSTDEVQNSMPLQQVEMLLPNKPDKSFEGNNTSLSTSLPPSSVFPTGEKDSSGANDIREQSCIQPSRQGAIQEGSLNCPVCCESAYGLMKMCQGGCSKEFHSSCAKSLAQCMGGGRDMSARFKVFICPTCRRRKGESSDNSNENES